MPTKNSAVRRKEPAARYGISTGKENTVVQSSKLSDVKNDGKKKRGLSLNVENRPVCTAASSTRSSSVGKAKFPIYTDDTDEGARSRPRARKDVCRKEIRARQDVEGFEKTLLSSTKIPESNSPALRAVLRRARSSSSNRYRLSSNKMVITNSQLYNRRAFSESRKISLQRSPYTVQLSDNKKISHLTHEVKKRTFSSIEMWRDKMRKHTGTVPKNTAKRTEPKKKCSPGFVDLQFDVLKNRQNNVNEYFLTPNEEPPKNERQSKADSLADVLKFLSNGMATLESGTHLKVPANANTRNLTPEIIQNDNSSSTIVSTSTPATGPSSLSLTPTKVRHEKYVMVKSSMNQETEIDVIGTNYILDYLDHVVETERTKEESAPRLFSRFLRENVSAKQRRLIVGYIIRLGVHCYYTSSIVYQTIKLFNVAIDRILVDTNNIQLVALACLWINLKREAPYNKIPSATVILSLAKDLYTDQEKDLLMYEKKILSAVNFNTRFADPFSLLSYYILIVNRDNNSNVVRSSDIARLYFCGSYMIDLSMLEESLCDIPTCVIAMAAVELSFHLVYSSDDNINEAWFQVWRRKQLTEWEERMMKSTKRLMLQHALTHDEFGSSVIYKKYLRIRFGSVTNFLQDKLITLKI
ncbi:PREDICTED: uncharacterized protein LOC105564366 isoform X1 [Vollenhovia emeryi]|uniref:uncharacterized protein LOC105564366 isoform X1 n=1 Tax=Vollenhovia emeryi TaxID=411798 RepID=UPI0005F4BBCB|nr:PREDICTED: uncharacterized protein LOC105564366 isoform X1 [Vollenhovia emeryi]